MSTTPLKRKLYNLITQFREPTAEEQQIMALDTQLASVTFYNGSTADYERRQGYAPGTLREIEVPGQDTAVKFANANGGPYRVKGSLALRQLLVKEGIEAIVDVKRSSETTRENYNRINYVWGTPVAKRKTTP